MSEIPKTKRCTGPCGLVKPSAEFSLKTGGKKLVSRCKICTAANMKERLHAKYPDRADRKLRRLNPEGILQTCTRCDKAKDLSLFAEATSRDGSAQKTCQSCENERREIWKKQVADGSRRIGQGLTFHHPTDEFGNKLCRTCGEWKNREAEFYVRGISADGFFNECKECRQKTASEYRQQPNIKILLDHRKQIYEAMIYNRVSNSKFVSVVGCLPEHLRKWIEFQFSTSMTWANYGKGKNCWNFDHVVPLIVFDITDEVERSLAFHWTNLQPCFDNGEKYKKIRKNDIETCRSKALEFCRVNDMQDDITVIDLRQDWLMTKIELKQLQYRD